MRKRRAMLLPKRDRSLQPLMPVTTQATATAEHRPATSPVLATARGLAQLPGQHQATLQRLPSAASR
jgi:hypothetical protein